MNRRRLIEGAIASYTRANPLAMEAHALQVQVKAFEDLADNTLRPEHPDAAEVVDLLALLARAALADLLGP